MYSNTKMFVIFAVLTAAAATIIGATTVYQTISASARTSPGDMLANHLDLNKFIHCVVKIDATHGNKLTADDVTGCYNSAFSQPPKTVSTIGGTQPEVGSAAISNPTSTG
jgi:hypothetical protein